MAALESDREVDNRHLKREHDQRVQHAEAAFKRWQKQVTEAVAGGRPPPSKPEEADRPGEYIEPKLYTTDVTIERMAQLLQARPQGMLLLTDELAGWFKNMSRYSGGSDDQFWLMAWDGKPYSVERKGSPAIKLDHLLIGVVGGIQPDRFAEVLKGPSDGMTARFLFAWPGEISYQPLRDTISETDRNIHALLNKLSNLPERDFNRLRLSQEARDEFERVRKEVFAKISLLDGREREWWSKIPAQCLRLAGVLIYLEWAVPDGGGPEPEVIKRRFIVDAADLLFDHFWPHAQAALRQIELSERHGDARRILRWIVAQRCEEISREEVRRKALRRNRDADQTTAILNKLVRAGWLRSIEPEENPVGGRPKLRWGVNPKLFEIE